MAMHIDRVTVRGRFGDLATTTRDALLATIDDHDFIYASFTPAGTLAYDAPLGPFTFRYELRALDEDDDDAADVVCERAHALATDALAGWGIAHGHLRVQATDMADVWKDWTSRPGCRIAHPGLRSAGFSPEDLSRL